MATLDEILNSVKIPEKVVPAPSPSLDATSQEGGSIFDIPIGTPRAVTPAFLPKPSKLDYAKMESLSDRLVAGWIPHFARADANLRYLAVEQEFMIWLDEHTLLVGKIDAIGQTQDGAMFFGEWKSQNPPPRNRKEEWKVKWRKRPQSLTYGFASDHLYPGTRRFTVRMAFKSDPPTYDYEWYEYSTEEIVYWKQQILNFAEEIRWRRKQGVVPWGPNFEHCFKYGPRYVCPFFHEACDKLNWSASPTGMVPRVSHLQKEREFQAENMTGTFGQVMDKKLVVLDATRIALFVECRERYRREYECDGGLMENEKEALIVGGDFHDLLGAYYKRRQ